MLEEKGVAQVVSLESLGRLTETPSPAINVYVLPYVRYSRHVNTLFYIDSIGLFREHLNFKNARTVVPVARFQASSFELCTIDSDDGKPEEDTRYSIEVVPKRRDASTQYTDVVGVEEAETGWETDTM
jgi:hypothetical protein